MSGENKATDAEIEIYINQIAQLMIRGIRRRSDILQYISRMNNLPDDKLRDTGWVKIEKCEKTIDTYTKRAREMLHEINEETLQETISLYLCQLEDLFREARKQGHLQTANNIMKNKMYLKGIGGFNIHGKFDVASFDVPLTDDEEKAYKQRMKDFMGEDFFNQMEFEKDKKEGKDCE
jgi:hypothetical protein